MKYASSLLKTLLIMKNFLMQQGPGIFSSFWHLFKALKEKIGEGFLWLGCALSQRRKENQSIARQTENDLPFTLKKAALSETKRATTALEKKIREEIGIEKKELLVVQNKLLEREAEIQALKKDLKISRNSVNEKSSQLEKAAVPAAALSHDKEKPEKKSQRQVKSSKQKSKKSAETISA